MQQFDQVIAVFNPLRLDDLKPRCRELIGVVGVWHMGWLGEDDETYPRQPAMMPGWWPAWEQDALRGVGWVGLCDLSICEAPDIHLDAVAAEARVRFWKQRLATEIHMVRLRAIASGV